jgi:hypothetical protein
MDISITNRLVIANMVKLLTTVGVINFAIALVFANGQLFTTNSSAVIFCLTTSSSCLLIALICFFLGKD